MTKEKKNTNQSHGFLHNSSVQNLIIFIVIIFLATAMAGRKQFVLDPYENFDPMPQVYITTTADNTHEKAHPLYSNKHYIPPALQLIPSQLLFSSGFHMFSAILYWTLTMGGVFILIRMGGFTNYQSMAMTLFALFAGNLITKELFDIPLLGPAPYIGYTHYNIRIYTIPLSTLGLIAIFNRRFLIAGILIGLVTFFHVKFGFRFFGLIFLSLLLWKFLGSRKLGLSQDEITWRKIFAFAMSWGILFVTTYLYINSKMEFFNLLEQPQSQPLTSQLAWLIHNEPDDYLVSHYFRSGRPFFGFLFMAIATGVFCETIIRSSTTDKMRKFAVVWEIGTFWAVVFWGVGFLFESHLIDWLPINLAHSIVLTRYWDSVWVIVLGFWITSIPASTLVGQKILVRIGKPQPIPQNVFFHFAIIFFLCSNIAIFFIYNDGELIKVSDRRSGKYPFYNIMHYVQICDPATSEYNKTYLQAVGSLKAKDGEGFQEAIFRLDTIYNKFKVNLKNPPLQNPDSSFLNTTNDLLNGQFAKAITATTEPRNIKGKDSYRWSCHDSEPGVHNRSVRIPTLDYLNAVDWIKLNIPFDGAVIQPPYLRKFTMLSQHIGFWDGKIDQHMMYIIKGYYGVGLHRLRSVAGPQAIDLEPETFNGRLGPRSREYFLSLTKEDILKIRQDYPAYDYLLTENKNLKGYLVVYSNPSLTLYDISGP